MAKKRPAQGIHSSPEKAGENMDLLPVEKEQDNMLAKIMFGYNENKVKTMAYKGLWTDEAFLECVENYFEYSASNNLKPCKAGLRLWLGCSRTQYYDWEINKTGTYGGKSDILAWASNIIEMSYIGRAEKYPTANIFLLKSSHGHVEANRLDITTNGNDINNADEVRDLVAKLGLDKTK